ncbi:hypothetical protein C5Y96_19025 [Blastopirellula marina]|uniref:Uncharacterized protein n=1 Tax=Blastopirellula marina TaxID=124 RepID=A0A2S8F644_9BACT|nr:MULTISPECIES: hypothetical protein [Pirellulaceae]PQO27621.1 hypothetical protein C5Y96_19025 [Blastopirellula marina]RCS48158.1 hypothetical protein DTL36_19050 [Bremerella cremea]
MRKQPRSIAAQFRCIRNAIFCLFVAGVLQLPTISLGETTAELQQFIIAGMRTERQQLKSGAYTANGKFSVKEPGSPAVSGEMSLKGFFDATQDKFRSDSKRPARTMPSADAKDKWNATSRKVVSTPDMSLFYNENFDRLEVHQPGVLELSSMPNTEGYLDVRVLGITSFSHLFKNRTIHDSFSELEKAPASECIDEGEGIYRIVWITGPEDRRFTIWVDTQNGFTPIRLQWQFYKIGSSGEWLDPFEVHEIGWRQSSSEWVPTSYRMNTQIALPSRSKPDKLENGTPATREIHYDLSFNWKSINEPLDDTLFEYESMELPVGTSLVDARSGDRERLGTTGVASGQPTAPEVRTRSPWVWLLVIGNVLFVIAVIAYFVARSRRA